MLGWTPLHVASNFSHPVRSPLPCPTPRPCCVPSLLCVALVWSIGRRLTGALARLPACPPARLPACPPPTQPTDIKRRPLADRVRSMPSSRSARELRLSTGRDARLCISLRIDSARMSMDAGARSAPNRWPLASSTPSPYPVQSQSTPSGRRGGICCNSWDVLHYALALATHPSCRWLLTACPSHAPGLCSTLASCGRCDYCWLTVRCQARAIATAPRLRMSLQPMIAPKGSECFAGREPICGEPM